MIFRAPLPETKTSSTPPKGCDVERPADPDVQLLAGALFAEADPKREANDEREGVAWSFVNSYRHTVALCDGTLDCAKELKPKKLAFMCRIDTRDLGATLESAVKIGSVAFGSTRWNKVMSGTEMLGAETLCKLDPAERLALNRSIVAAGDVVSGTATSVDFIRFNKAKDTPPSDRLERSERIGKHSFYRFKVGRECG